MTFSSFFSILYIYIYIYLELGEGTSERKRALYHCNYCNKDITGKIRIKCAICPGFDLCIECFSVGAEVTPHKSNHPYRVMVSKMPPGNIFSCPDNLLNCQIFFLIYIVNEKVFDELFPVLENLLSQSFTSI